MPGKHIFFDQRIFGFTLLKTNNNDLFFSLHRGCSQTLSFGRKFTFTDLNQKNILHFKDQKFGSLYSVNIYRWSGSARVRFCKPGFLQFVFYLSILNISNYKNLKEAKRTKSMNSKREAPRLVLCHYFSF